MDNSLRFKIGTQPSIADGNRLFLDRKYAEALDVYKEMSSKHPALAGALKSSILRCEEKMRLSRHDTEDVSLDKSVQMSALATVKGGIGGEVDQPSARPRDLVPEITITLTTIKSRLSNLKPVVESLHRQALLPASIQLNISQEPYLLDEGIDAKDSLLAQLSAFPLLNVNWVENTGPYRKIWPLLERHFAQTLTNDKIFVTVDDDTIYPDYFLQTLYDTYLTHDCVVAYRGRHIETHENNLTPYNKWTWGQNAPCLSNLPTGKDGIIYNTNFFTRDFLSLKDALQMAPTADDLWIRWHCALNGVPAIILNPEACTSDYKSFPVVDYSPEYRNVSLYAKHNSSTSHGKNDLSVQELERHFLAKYGYNLNALLQQVDGMS
jgi:hypothetical protein